MEPKVVDSFDQPTAQHPAFPPTAHELDLLTSFRQLSSDDQGRLLSLVQAMAAVGHQHDFDLA